MTRAPTENQACQVSEQSVLRKIFGAKKVSRMERAARANRLRELLLSLKTAALSMEPSERLAFAELVQLARDEHLAATEDEGDATEVESVSLLVQKMVSELDALRDANAKMHAIAKRLQAKESSSLWTRLVGKIGVHKTKE
ncbi:hypothetical protein C8C96_4836 [Acidovorax sp. 100]|nr:hypothetical protein C8C96_4836 [Acidovorax sp. 100]